MEQVRTGIVPADHHRRANNTTQLPPSVPKSVGCQANTPPGLCRTTTPGKRNCCTEIPSPNLDAKFGLGCDHQDFWDVHVSPLYRFRLLIFSSSSRTHACGDFVCASSTRNGYIYNRLPDSKSWRLTRIQTEANTRLPDMSVCTRYMGYKLGIAAKWM